MPEATPATKPRSILVAITACDGGVVVIQAASSPPRVLQGESARVLHELAHDTSLPEHTEKPGSNTFARVVDLAERLLRDGDG